MPRPRAHRSAQKSLAPPPLLGPRLKKWAVRRLARSHSGPAHKAFLSGRVGSGGPDDYIPGPRADAFPRLSRRRPIETRLIRPSGRYSDWTVRCVGPSESTSRRLDPTTLEGRAHFAPNSRLSRQVEPQRAPPPRHYSARQRAGWVPESAAESPSAAREKK